MPHADMTVDAGRACGFGGLVGRTHAAASVPSWHARCAYGTHTVGCSARAAATRARARASPACTAAAPSPAAAPPAEKNSLSAYQHTRISAHRHQLQLPQDSGKADTTGHGLQDGRSTCEVRRVRQASPRLAGPVHGDARVAGAQHGSQCGLVQDVAGAQHEHLAATRGSRARADDSQSSRTHPWCCDDRTRGCAL